MFVGAKDIVPPFVMQPVHPVQLVSFFAELEKFFYSKRQDVIASKLQNVGLSKKFLRHAVALDGFSARYDIWLHGQINDTSALIWMLSLSFGEESILVSITRHTKDENGEDSVELLTKEYTSVAQLHTDLRTLCNTMEHSMTW